MSHALLLRLFLSPSFFSVNVALQYLMIYSDNIGITYYLTRRLKEIDAHELRDVWGFVCHLLITRPSKSRALECFVIEMSEKSTHLAMFTLWFMQAYLKDLAPARHGTKMFTICHRVLHRCHEIIFGDLPGPAASPYASLKIPFHLRLSRTRVKAHVEPAIIGIGCVLASAFGMPTLANVMGTVAIEQGRVEDSTQAMNGVEGFQNEDKVPEAIDPSLNVQEEDEDADNGLSARAATTQMDLSKASVNGESQMLSLKLASLSRRQTISAAQTSPALPLNITHVPLSKATDDPFGQLDTSSSAAASAPYKSSPSISTIKRSQRSSSVNAVDDLLQQYDLKSRRYLLQSYYCRSEVQFILSLENISNRLLVVPKPARVSSLRAELTSLNHKLPAEICMPMWCNSLDTFEGSKNTKPHHRIVRIPPGESVVLNSAERAPFLLLIEILNGDLDFDPTKRNNTEVLKKIISKDHSIAGHSRVPFKSKSVPNANNFLLPTLPISTDAAFVRDTAEPIPDIPDDRTVQSFPRDPNELELEEEMDLVEQVYGSDLSIRHTPDLSESLFPSAPKNKALDAVTWSRSSMPPSPAMTPTVSFSGSTNTKVGQSEDHQTDVPTSSDLYARSPILSLDEYSERMRTAAVMLAQLNANLVRESVTPLARHESTVGTLDAIRMDSRLSWLPGSNRNVNVTDKAASGPLHPSLSGTARDASGSGTAGSTRMRLQPSEAASIRDRIMQEMLSLEDERMERMRESNESDGMIRFRGLSQNMKTAEDESIIRRELSRVDPSAVIFQESWPAKKSRIRQGSPYGHLASWDCVSVIMKTGGDLRQEQLAVQIIREFERIWQEEHCPCWVRYFRILITGGSSGLVETITDSVSIHSIKKAEYARRLAEGRLGHVTLLDHFITTYGDPSSAKFARAQRNFAKSLAGYSIVTYLLQIKDRHNGNILLDRDGHLIHIDFGFMLSNSPGNIGFEAAPFKFPFEYIEVLGGMESKAFLEFKSLFRQGFEAARKHCDRIINIVELMQKDSSLPCFAALGEQTAQQLRDRFQPALTHSLVGEYIERLIMNSLGSNWTRLYDSYQYYAQSIL